VTAASTQRDRPKHRFFADNLSGGEVTLAPAETHHALHVLRLSAGDAVELFDGRGSRGRGTIRRAGRGEVVVGIEMAEGPAPRPAPAVHVASALPKGNRLDWMLQKLTELAVHGFTPLACERSVATVRDERRTLERWQTICIGAARQSGQSYIPALHGSATVAEMLAAPAEGLRVIAHGGAQDVPAIAKVAAAPAKEPIWLWIGPEGGWSDAELAAAVAAGVCPARLGHTTLRTETAAIALVAAVIACRDDRS